jgi:hypothetical protein
MIASMLSREPSERPTFDRILATYRGTVFPEYFYTFLKDYATELAELPDSPDRSSFRRPRLFPVARLTGCWNNGSRSVSIWKGRTTVSKMNVIWLTKRRPGTPAPQHCHVVNPQCTVPKFETAWPQAVPQSVPFFDG